MTHYPTVTREELEQAVERAKTYYTASSRKKLGHRPYHTTADCYYGQNIKKGNLRLGRLPSQDKCPLCPALP